MKYFVSWAGRTVPVELRDAPSGTPGDYEVIVEGETHHVHIENGHLLVGNRVVSCLLDAKMDRAHFAEATVTYSLSTVDPASAAAAQHLHRPELRAPMPGKLVELRVESGALIEPGQCVAVIEAMKMQNELCVPFAARVTRVHVAAGDTLEAGALLLELEQREVNDPP